MGIGDVEESHLILRLLRSVIYVEGEWGECDYFVKLLADTLLLDSCKTIEKECKAWISGHSSRMRESMYLQRSALMISPKRTGKRSSGFFRLPGQ